MAFGDVHNCSCELANAESMAKHECGLCREAEKQPATVPVFFLKDINPRKPNRWLALPRAHTHLLADLTAEERTVFWTAAIQKARELFGEQWGLAVNGDASRTQCHVHVHIGKLLDDAENRDFVVVNGPADIPVPQDGAGFWVHPVAGKLHVHGDEDVTETVLMR
jgi:diadenosine tetraphosphate (Ap4A) HIT family hydrolase